MKGSFLYFAFNRLSRRYLTYTCVTHTYRNGNDSERIRESNTCNRKGRDKDKCSRETKTHLQLSLSGQGPKSLLLLGLHTT